MKNIVFFYFSIVLVLCSCNSSSEKKSENKIAEKTKTRIIKGNGFEMTVPSYLKDTEKKYGELVYITDTEKEIYFQLYKTDKIFFLSSLANRNEIPEGTDLLPTFHRNFAESSTINFENSGFIVKTPPVTTKITVNNTKAIQSEFTLEIEKTDFNYSLISIDGEKEYYYVYCWYIKSIDDVIHTEIIDMLNSIKIK